MTLITSRPHVVASGLLAMTLSQLSFASQLAAEECLVADSTVIQPSEPFAAPAGVNDFGPLALQVNLSSHDAPAFSPASDEVRLGNTPMAELGRWALAFVGLAIVRALAPPRN